MPEYIEVDQMWKCETCFHHRSGKCALGAFGCDHGESYRPAYNKLKKADVAPVVPELRVSVRFLHKQYESAKKNPIVRNPVAYALYQTWKAVEDCENGR